jgi:hypothetical protein
MACADSWLSVVCCFTINKKSLHPTPTTRHNQQPATSNGNGNDE